MSNLSVHTHTHTPPLFQLKSAITNRTQIEDWIIEKVEEHTHYPASTCVIARTVKLQLYVSTYVTAPLIGVHEMHN